ncbi:golgin subfamily A member 6-like protein 1 [Pecten maximus]|uniref:golgin subfamily A member 6-like protein 1 n=1 Tax=Pecten maximus TaxID=6579 RepID=UPI001458A38D|nr:golgin subfamily A member 6-like protein 1 [Pecten maximus]
MALKIKGIPTIFGETFEKNVTFCVDTSGSMFKGLDVVKEHLVETLLKHAQKSQPTSFNIIEFNSEVTQWADKMVKCSAETVEVAAEWVKRLSAKTGTNTLDALLTALEDRGCDAVYLVTDGLPDQHPVDILDQVTNAVRGRPIHCIYLCAEDTMDTSAIEFLEDLSVESYGSFHIITLTQHGCVERITPIYRADHAHERIIRTLNGTIHNHAKQCTVATTLKVDPEESLALTPRVSFFNQYAGYPCNPHVHPAWGSWFMQPYRYYFPNGWSRYRPARGWLKSQEAMHDHIENAGVSPAAGALIIGKKVLARRIDDGYFYLGTIKSQILADKFLVAFGPCKQGKYKETTYQDTFVYDLVDYDDAKRHTVITSDKVLAPWEPKGERFGPGIVIEGHEKRDSDGPDDQQITVTFSNGRTERVSSDTALWVPEEVYERLVLELKMPREARETLQTNPHYPLENLPGYPTSGPHAEPRVYEQPHPVTIDVASTVGSLSWQYPYTPDYPVQLKGKQSLVKSAVSSNDMNQLVPGTDMTRGQLNEKITSQLMEHKLTIAEKQNEEKAAQEEKSLDVEKKEYSNEKQLMEESEKALIRAQQRERTEEELAMRIHLLERELELERMKELRRQEEKDLELKQQMEIDQQELEKQMERESLLRKREKQEENLLRKSVSFKDDILVEDLDKSAEEEVKDRKMEETQADMPPQPQENFDYKFFGGEYNNFAENVHKCHPRRRRGSPTRRSHSPRQRSLSPPRRNRSPARDFNVIYRRPGSAKRSQNKAPWIKYWGSDSAPEMIGPNKPGPFRETALQAPLEAKDHSRTPPYSVEWANSAFKYVDPYAKHCHTSSVETLLKPPKLQNGMFPPHRPSQPVTRTMSADAKEEARREFRRKKVVQRQVDWNQRLYQQDRMKELMQDNHRERIVAQMEHDRQRQINEERMVHQSREAKKQISAELRSKREEVKKQQEELRIKRIAAMRERRENRETEHIKKEQETITISEQRQQVRVQNSQKRWDEHQQRIQVEEIQNRQHHSQVLNAKLNRIEHFRNLENEGQQRKDLRLAVSEQHLANYRSQVLP